MESDVTTYMGEMTKLTRKARKTFLAAVLLCAVLALNISCLRDGTAGRLADVRSCFVPLLFWALTAASYAFHSLAEANARMSRKTCEVLAADHARAMRRLSAIKERLATTAFNHRK